MTNSSTVAVPTPASENTLKDALDKLNYLYNQHDTFFSADPDEKQGRLRELADDVLRSTEAFGEGRGDERAQLAYIKGRTLDVFEEFNPEAEEFLSRSVKLDPERIESWNALAHCFWKKGDLRAAHECYDSALGVSENKESLRQLSMLLRQKGSTTSGAGTSESGENSVISAAQSALDAVQLSVEKAKRAVALDVTDGESWYVLGNALVALFFSASHAAPDLERALKAYASAERNGSEGNPDLFFNRGNVYKYQEQYQLAVDDYSAAAALDPSLPCYDHIDQIRRRVRRTSELVARKGGAKGKRLLQLVSRLPPLEGEALGRSRVGLASLSVGANPGTALFLKQLVPIAGHADPPDSFVMVDKEGNCVCLSIYHLASDVSARFSEKDEFLVLDPRLETFTFTHNAAVFSYDCIQVRDPAHLLCNGYPMAGAAVAHAELKLDNFDQ